MIPMILTLAAPSHAAKWSSAAETVQQSKASAERQRTADDPTAHALQWTAARAMIQLLDKTCADFDGDEFDRHDCAKQIESVQADARALLSEGLVWTELVTWTFGEYDFDAQVFPLSAAPRSGWTYLSEPLTIQDPAPCIGAVATGAMCLFAEKPTIARVKGSVGIKGGFAAPRPSQVTVFTGPDPGFKTQVVDSDTARQVRDLARNVMGSTYFRWSWDASRCQAATPTSVGACWGEVDVLPHTIQDHRLNALLGD